MLRIGLTGGIGAGKSTVSTELARLGAVIIDADKIAREVVEPGTPGLTELVEAFGNEILLPDGTLDRPALAAVAFRDDASRTQLNQIVHPKVGQRTSELIIAAPPHAVVVHDIPLLIENGLAPTCNLVMVVHAEEQQRIDRLTSHRGMSPDDARARIAAQATDEQRRAAADVWLDNTGSQDALREQVRHVWHTRIVPFEHNVRTGNDVLPDEAVVEFNPEWEAQARRVIARLWVLCGGLAKSIEFVGPKRDSGEPVVDLLNIEIVVETEADMLQIGKLLSAEEFPASPKVGLHRGADPARPLEIQIRHSK
ncbi:dephospho-CoA kinase [Hoyosella rhizosphaerae]|uniref:Dephospho-CoA kinase n=1 Tax=Hoyosella rhizosphaerae TaxID=1755582 RepID=A0A916UGE8_9ACTN|nr:dephospho-CoA kinase [Hoyosella rhizosphaerae]MBN4925515.1 dephospho-CoA kinase [Hoyosella rhizosphaerae]GGC70018.1 dephospho-CoA kinase [Hoyosella rhizosphaerae]